MKSKLWESAENRLETSLFVISYSSAQFLDSNRKTSKIEVAGQVELIGNIDRIDKGI